MVQKILLYHHLHVSTSECMQSTQAAKKADHSCNEMLLCVISGCSHKCHSGKTPAANHSSSLLHQCTCLNMIMSRVCVPSAVVDGTSAHVDVCTLNGVAHKDKIRCQPLHRSICHRAKHKDSLHADCQATGCIDSVTRGTVLHESLPSACSCILLQQPQQTFRPAPGRP